MTDGGNRMTEPTARRDAACTCGTLTGNHGTGCPHSIYRISTARDAAVDAVISVAKNFDSCFDGKVTDDCPESTYLCSHWEAAVRAAVEQAISASDAVIAHIVYCHDPLVDTGESGKSCMNCEAAREAIWRDEERDAETKRAVFSEDTKRRAADMTYHSDAELERQRGAQG